jgi:RimJ/RimL family protein N-acetyltransferase
MIIETERLVLREIDPERDFDAWAETMADADTVRYLGAKPMVRAEAWRNMAVAIGHWAIRGYGMFSLEHRQTGEWIGRVGPYFPEGWPGPEIGWTISPKHRGQGYATEAGRAAIDFAFETLGWPRVIHCILEGNEASRAVAERLGSRKLEVLQGLPGITPEPVLIYGQSREEWIAQRLPAHPVEN